MSGRLVVCPTPIGNLQDLTLRALDVLRSADVVACEDTRHTRGLLERHGIRTATVSYHEHNERARSAELVRRIERGEVVALVSDAGMPGVSDPGAVVVRDCVDAGVRVEVLPGASAVPVALVLSGLAAEPWRFVGFLPRKAGELAGLWRSSPETTVAFESPRRLGTALAALAEADPGRPVAVCRELTKLHEEVVRGTAGELAAHYADAEVRGEIVLVAGPATTGDGPDLGSAAAALRALVDAGARARPAAQVVAELTGAPANALYRALLDRKG